jgi:hypothetical protein
MGLTNSIDEPHPTGADNSFASTEIANGVSDNLVFVLREKRHFYYETRPMPTLPSENHVIVAVCATGLCGSDVCTPNFQTPQPFYAFVGSESLIH